VAPAARRPRPRGYYGITHAGQIANYVGSGVSWAKNAAGTVWHGIGDVASDIGGLFGFGGSDSPPPPPTAIALPGGGTTSAGPSASSATSSTDPSSFYHDSGIPEPQMFQWRLPDAITLNVSVGPWFGWSGSLTLDRYGQLYYSAAGMQVGKSPLLVGASLTGAWMVQDSAPSATQLMGAIPGSTLNVSGGFGGGATFSVGPDGNAGWNQFVGIGFMTPQIGGGYSYTSPAPWRLPASW
jgi:hypothetical protein